VENKPELHGILSQKKKKTFGRSLKISGKAKRKTRKEDEPLDSLKNNFQFA